MLGFPMVLIGGQPAARLGDMHVCPMLTPGVPPIPHVGGPVTMGFPLVLIGGQPAARMGDMLMCVGPPDSIAMGCPTVLIGDGAGGGGAAAGGSGIGALAAGIAKEANAGSGDSTIMSLMQSLITALNKPTQPTGMAAILAGLDMALHGSKESSTRAKHWVEFDVVDKAGNPVSGVSYRFTDAQGKESLSILAKNGKIVRDGLAAGSCNVELFHVSDARWSKEEAPVGEKVKMSARVEGYPDGTHAFFKIYMRKAAGPDALIKTISCTTQGESVSAEWEYVPPATAEKERNPSAGHNEGNLSSEFYFEVLVKSCKARSGFLNYTDFLEIEVKDEDGKPFKDEEYILYLSNGEVRRGKLDGNGYRKEERVPPGPCHLSFPRYWPHKVT